MNGFVANSPAATETDILQSGFYPDISPSDFRAVMRLDQSITPQRLRHSLINAINDTNGELRGWKASQIEAGHTTLTEVPADDIDGESVKAQLYKRAVYNTAKAELVERYRDYDSTLSGSQRADEMEETIDQYRRNAIVAIRELTDRPRSAVELI